MAPAPETNGLLNAVVSGLLAVFVIVGGAIAYYAIRDEPLPLTILRRELRQLAQRSHPAVFDQLAARIGEHASALLEPVMTPARDGGETLRVQIEKLMPIVPLTLLRAAVLVLALPLLGPLMCVGLLEGLWRREGIAATTGYSSAAGFSAGKFLSMAAALVTLGYIFLPASMPLSIVMPALLTIAPTGVFLLARNLPLHI